MKNITRIFLLVCLLGAVLPIGAQDMGDIKLPPPSQTRGSNMMKTLADRSSHRESTPRELSLQDLSDLLWAANGINRPTEHKRTAPSAMNKQDIDLYVFLRKGTYKYQASGHSLKYMLKGDNRNAVIAGQDYEKLKNFPVFVVLVSDLSKFGVVDLSKFSVKNEGLKMAAAMDAGIISQNINLFCSAVGWNTVPRITMNVEDLRKLLKLGDKQLPLMNNPVGYRQ